MKKSLIPLSAVVLFAIGIFAPSAFAGDLTHDQVAAAKVSTALLIVGDGSGTAFCVSETGVFITCNHVVENEKNVSIIIDPSQKDEKKYPAHVLRTFPKSDLAVLKVDLDRKIPALKLGDDSTLFETQQLFAFGYPFGLDMANDEKSNPAISVNSGHVTSLRKDGDALWAIQLDAMLNPGNSGGPVLDEKGEVVGIVAAGLPGTGVNLAIPVSLLKKEMNAPVLTVQAPDINFEDRYKPVDFPITLDWLTPPPGIPTVTLEIIGGGQDRRVAAAKGNDGKYHAVIAPLIPPPVVAKIKLHVTLQFDGGSVAGDADDVPLTIQGKQKMLSQIATITPSDKGPGFLADGEPAGLLPEIAAMRVDIGGAVTMVNGQKAKRIDIVAPSQDPGPVSYKVTITQQNGSELASAQGNVTIHSAPVVAGPSQLPDSATALTGATTLTTSQTFELPSPADDLVAAQDGRSLVFHLKDVKKLAVFDVVDLKFRGYINLSQEPVLFGGGSRYLLVAYPGIGVIERYSLQTLQKDRTVTSPAAEIKNLTMGYSSPRYALFTVKGSTPFGPEVDIFDADRMAVQTTSKDDKQFNMLSGGGNTELIRASADGRTYGFCRVGISPTGFSIVSFKNDQLSLFYQHVSAGLLLPNGDGSEIFTTESGIYTAQYSPVVKAVGNWSQGTCFLPSYHPAYFIGVPYNELQGGSRKNASKSIAIYSGRSSQPLTYLDGFDEMTEKDAGMHSSTPPLTPDKRYHFYPQLNLFITIPATNDRIVAHPVDIKKVMDEKGISYLYATTTPPVARISQRVNFKIQAVSKAGGVTFSLQSGPAGLTVANDGTVNWQAPAKPTEESVIVSMKDASGQEVFYTFQMVVTN